MPADAGMRRCAVVGSPIAHSLSPVLHRAAYAHLGLAWEYTRAEMGEGELAAFVRGLDDSWRGLSVTMPLKRDALVLAGRVDPVAELAGAVNTLVFEPGGTVRGYNTDVGGMIASVRAAAPGEEFDAACVWGGGSTAASAMVALAEMKVAGVHLHVRDASRARGALDTAGRAGVDVRVRPWATVPDCLDAGLLVLTAPAGAMDGVARDLAGGASEGRVLFDVVYDPWPTVAADAWKGAGGRVASGLDLLVHQAVGQVRLMTGKDVSADVLYGALS